VVTCVPESIPDKLKAFLVGGGQPHDSVGRFERFREAFKEAGPPRRPAPFLMDGRRHLAHLRAFPACSHLEKWGVAYSIQRLPLPAVLIHAAERRSSRSVEELVRREGLLELALPPSAWASGFVPGAPKRSVASQLKPYRA